MKNAVIFGVGHMFKKIKKYLFDNYKIVSIVDNDSFCQGMHVLGIVVSDPAVIKTVQYDLIIVTSQNQKEIINQLASLGIPSEKVINGCDLVSVNKDKNYFLKYKPGNPCRDSEFSFTSPLISILVPVFNNERYLSNAIESVLNQEFTDIEIIIIDDGSTDNTPQIADEFARIDSRVSVIHQENQYFYAALNNAIIRAAGEYIFHLNSDDTLYPNSLQTMANIAKKYNPDVIYAKVLSHQCDENQTIIHYDSSGWDALALSDAFYDSKESFRNNYIYSYKSRLAYNSANLYRTKIAKNHKFRNDIFGADLLFNVAIADDISSAYVCAAPVYNHFVYGHAQYNISIGKWYAYSNEMVIDFYNEHQKLFVKWNILSDEIEQTLAADRISDFSWVCRSLFAQNCNITADEKLRKIFSEYIDETAYNCADKFGRIGEIERLVFSFCREMFKEKEVVCERSDFYFVYEMLEILRKPLAARSEDDMVKLKSAACNINNPWSVGKIYIP